MVSLLTQKKAVLVINRRAVCGSDSIYYRVTEIGIEIMATLGGQDTDEEL